MVNAIQRRRQLELQAEGTKASQPIDPEELRNLDWAKNKEELITRINKIVSLQLETAKKWNEDESQDHFLQRIKKRRIYRETEILGNSPEEKKIQMLSFILKASASSLDAHTNYLTPSEASQFIIQVQKRLFGIGAQLKDNLNGFSVVRIIEGGPASQANKLKINDLIIAVNNEPVVGMDIVDAVEQIRGEKGTPVLLTILRENKEANEKNIQKLDVEIIRGEVVLEEARFETHYEPFADGVIAFINLYSFYQDPNNSSSGDIKAEIERMKKDHNLKGVILDLRNNSGGLLPQAVGVSGLFMTKGIVVSIKDSMGQVQHLRNLEGKMTWDGPLLILTNRASASASEIVAQSLQDYGRAIVVGDDKTFGKGTFQTSTLDISKNNSVNPQGEYKVTRGMYYTVSGKSPQLKGVKTDIEIPGILSEMEIGEEFSKYPLDNDQIDPHFEDDLSDIHPVHRNRLSLLYKHNLQTKMTTYLQYLDALKRNSEKRIKENKNYQNFIKEIQNKNFESQTVELFGQSDLQLIEACNIMKDLIFLIEVNEKYAPTY